MSKKGKKEEGGGMGGGGGGVGRCVVVVVVVQGGPAGVEMFLHFVSIHWANVQISGFDFCVF